MVRVEVFDNNAVYVDDTRITDRSTKWPASKMIARFQCPKEDVVTQLKERNFAESVRRIDDKEYEDA